MTDLERRLELVLKDLGRAEDAATEASANANAALDYVSAAYATAEDILADMENAN